jgi:hypothetical protein
LPAASFLASSRAKFSRENQVGVYACHDAFAHQVLALRGVEEEKDCS